MKHDPQVTIECDLCGDEVFVTVYDPQANLEEFVENALIQKGWKWAPETAQDICPNCARKNTGLRLA